MKSLDDLSIVQLIEHMIAAEARLGKESTTFKALFDCFIARNSCCDEPSPTTVADPSEAQGCAADLHIFASKLRGAERFGSEIDLPQGTRFIKIGHTYALTAANALEASARLLEWSNPIRPSEESLVYSLEVCKELAHAFRAAPRVGNAVDDPEGTRWITFSATAADQIAEKLDRMIEQLKGAQ